MIVNIQRGNLDEFLMFRRHGRRDPRVEFDDDDNDWMVRLRMMNPNRSG